MFRIMCSLSHPSLRKNVQVVNDSSSNIRSHNLCCSNTGLNVWPIIIMSKYSIVCESREEGCWSCIFIVYLCDHVCAGKSLEIGSDSSASQMGLPLAYIGQSKFTWVYCVCVHLSIRCVAHCKAKRGMLVFP